MKLWERILILLVCLYFVFKAKSNTVGMCQNAEISETSSKRRRLSSQTHSDDKCTDVLDLQKFSMAASSNTHRACPVENCPTDPFEVFHLWK